MFLYFDMGNVLIEFSHRRAAEQMAAVAGVPAERVWELVFAGDLNLRADAGELDGRAYYEEFCRATGTRPDFDALARACCDIFRVNLSIVPLVAQLAAAGYRLGVLSNTCDLHWAWVTRHYAIMRQTFDVHALSYELRAVKPQRRIYELATALAGCRPDEIFFVDDVPAHVEAARQFGWDAVPYTTTAVLAADLRRRGVTCNY